MKSLVALLLAQAASVTPAAAALPSPPFALYATPAQPSAGEAVTITVVPRGGTGRYDLYLMWATGVRAAFLTPDGRWSPRPIPWLVGASAASGVIAQRWGVPGPPGDVPLALVMVAPGADPLDRTQWQSRPALASLRVSRQASRPAGARCGCGDATGGSRRARDRARRGLPASLQAVRTSRPQRHGCRPDDQAGLTSRTISAAVGLRPACFFENTTLPSTVTSS